jgi:RNA-directed DNA polymerase
MQMTADSSAGAASHLSPDWQAIPWKTVNETVRRLQARIVQATKAGKWHKVHALQHWLTHSCSGKALAVRRVTENQGKNTPGVDTVLWKAPESKGMARHQMQRRGYKARPLRRVYIPQSNGKKRPLSLPTMQERAMQALYLHALEPIAATLADPNSYGFRKERSCADAMEQGATVLSNSPRPQWILEGDIKSCFDKSSHPWLLSHIPMEKTMLNTWRQAGSMAQSVLSPTADGAPQGGISSPVLANMALDGLERLLRKKYPHSGPKALKGMNKQVNLVRYCADFLITGISKEVLAQEVKPLVTDFLWERGLELSEEKTRITHIEDGFDILGQQGRKYNGKFLTRPSKKNVKAFLTDIRKVIKDKKAATAYGLIATLNPKIRGWANFHRHAAAKKTLVHVDTAIVKALWRWTRRRQPKKGQRWVKDRYCGRVGNQNWRFFGTAKDKDGKPPRTLLCLASAIPITRDTKIKGDWNPYDPTWEIYLAKRLGVKMEQPLLGRRRLMYLWKAQGGICPVCHPLIPHVTGWHNHHIVYKTLGGYRQRRAPRPDPSQLPHTSSCQRARWSETASRESWATSPARGVIPGLSWMKGNFHVQF